MTTPPAGPPCDVCGTEPAHISLMTLADYGTVKIGLGCMPKFFAGIAADMQGVAPEPAPRPDDPPVQVTAVLGPDGVDSGAQPVYRPPARAGDVSRETPAAVPSPYSQQAHMAAEANGRALLAALGHDNPAEADCPGCGTICFTIPGHSLFVCLLCGEAFTAGEPAVRAVPGPLAGRGRPAFERGDLVTGDYFDGVGEVVEVREEQGVTSVAVRLPDNSGVDTVQGIATYDPGTLHLAPPPAQEPEECPETSDGQHTQAWREGGKCAACGLAGQQGEVPF